MRTLLSLIIFCCLINACKKAVTLDQRVIGTVENFCNKDAITNLKLRITEIGPIGTNTDLSVYPQREKAITFTDERGVYEFQYDINAAMLYTISLEAPNSALGYFGEGTRTIDRFSPLVEHTFRLCNKAIINISFADTLSVDSLDLKLTSNSSGNSCYLSTHLNEEGIVDWSQPIQDTVPCGAYLLQSVIYRGSSPDFIWKEVLLFPDETNQISFP